MRAKQPGALIQIEHMSVNFSEGFSLKEFKASCPVTGITIMRAYSRASRCNARHFLKLPDHTLAYPLLSVQVDGGSEFRDALEQIGQVVEIPVFVLAPKKPQYNGSVARANGTSRDQFYPFYEGSLTLSAINRELDQYQHYYNHYRPHDGVGLKTPMSYYKQLVQAA